MSADTVVELDGVIYEKPENEAQHRAVLKRFRDSQTPVNVLTSFILIIDGQVRCKRVVRSELVFNKRVSDETIEQYVATGEGADASGGLKVHQMGAVLVDKISGSFNNVIGLPGDMVFWELKRLLSAD